MKLLKMFFVLSLYLSVVILQNSAYARSPAEVARDLAKASDAAVSTYSKEGMSGLIVKTQECYERNTGNLFYCVYLDMASRHVDQIVIEVMRFPPNEFFVDESFLSRVGPVLIGAKMDMNAANQYLATVTPVINNLVEKKLLGKR